MNSEKPIKINWKDIKKKAEVQIHNSKVNLAVNEAIFDEAVAQLAKK